MLNIIIAETNKTKTLSLIDPKTNVDWINDFIGNNDGFGINENDIDSKFVKAESLDKYSDFEGDSFVTSKANYEWWLDIVNSQQTLDDLVIKAKELGVSDDDINDALDQPQSDLDNLITAQTQEISELIETAK